MDGRNDHNSSQIDHKPGLRMSLAVSQISTLARRAIDLQARKIGADNQQQAIRSVAREERIAPGTVRNALYGRFKRPCAALRDALYRRVLSAITAEIGALNAELETARRCGVDPRDGELAQIKADIAALEKAMRGEI